jgi:hypothetical protein
MEIVSSSSSGRYAASSPAFAAPFVEHLYVSLFVIRNSPMSIESSHESPHKMRHCKTSFSYCIWGRVKFQLEYKDIVLYQVSTRLKVAAIELGSSRSSSFCESFHDFPTMPLSVLRQHLAL